MAARIGEEPRIDAGAAAASAGMTAGGPILSVPLALFGASRKKRHREMLKQKSQALRNQPLDELVNMEPNNFELSYAYIDKIVVNDGGPTIGQVKIEGDIKPILDKLNLPTTAGFLTKKPRREITFNITSGQDLEQCEKVVARMIRIKLAK